MSGFGHVRPPANDMADRVADSGEERAWPSCPPWGDFLRDLTVWDGHLRGHVRHLGPGVDHLVRSDRCFFIAAIIIIG